jgi:hypothetical protein
MALRDGYCAQHRPDFDFMQRPAQIKWNGGIGTRLFDRTIHPFEGIVQSVLAVNDVGHFYEAGYFSSLRFRPDADGQPTCRHGAKRRNKLRHWQLLWMLPFQPALKYRGDKMRNSFMSVVAISVAAIARISPVIAGQCAGYDQGELASVMGNANLAPEARQFAQSMLTLCALQYLGTPQPAPPQATLPQPVPMMRYLCSNSKVSTRWDMAGNYATLTKLRPTTEELGTFGIGRATDGALLIVDLNYHSNDKFFVLRKRTLLAVDPKAHTEQILAQCRQIGG